MATPQQYLSYLTGTLGYTPTQAAALLGNMEQESGFNPNSINKGEGAYGLLQWRGPRLAGLQQFAQSQGADPSDWRTQLNFARYEMQNGEAKNSTGFLNSSSLPQANASLKQYIRYGDDSEGTRLSNAQNYLPSQYASLNAPPLTPGSPAPPLPPPINIGGPTPQQQPSTGLLAGLGATPAQASRGLLSLASLGGTAPQQQQPADQTPQIPLPRPVRPQVNMQPLLSLLSRPNPLNQPSAWSI